MTDPTAKGYTAPTIEEMKAAVLEVYDLGVIHTSQGYSSFWPHGMRPRFFIRYNEKDGVSGTDRAWADAYSKLAAKAAPTSDGNEISSHMHCSGPCCMPELYASGVKGCKPAAMTDLERVQASYITGSQTYTPESEAAPESEDEAFERFFAKQWPDGGSIIRDVSLIAWNARARLDAERGR